MFSQAVNETFPELDQSLRDEIIQKVSEHMLESLKEEVYKDNPSALANLNLTLSGTQDKEEGSKVYGESIMKELLSFPEEKQKMISENLDIELTKVMHQIYLSVKS